MEPSVRTTTTTTISSSFAHRARYSAAGAKLGHGKLEVPRAWAERQAARCIQRVARGGLARQQTARKVVANAKGKVGVVVTTHGEYGVFARSSVYSLVEHLPSPYHIVLVVNRSTDPITLRLVRDVRRRPDMQARVLEDDAGGLTRTWNIGIRLCKRAGCTSVILMNHDLVVNPSISHLVSACHEARKPNLLYFGPLMNRPGPEDHNQAQLGACAEDREPFVLEDAARADQKAPLNGAIMAFPIRVLEATKFDLVNYFDPSFPYGGNEVEWFHRAQARGGAGVVVPRAYVQHYKFGSWRSQGGHVRKSDAVYTAVQAGGRVPSCPQHDDSWERYLFSTDDVVLGLAEEKGWIPMWVSSDESMWMHKVKWNPCGFLPAWITDSLYCDSAHVDRLEPLGYVRTRFSQAGWSLTIWESHGKAEIMLRQHESVRTGAFEERLVGALRPAENCIEKVREASLGAGLRCQVRKMEGLGGIVRNRRS